MAPERPDEPFQIRGVAALDRGDGGGVGKGWCSHGVLSVLTMDIDEGCSSGLDRSVLVELCAKTGHGSIL